MKKTVFFSIIVLFLCTCNKLKDVAKADFSFKNTNATIAIPSTTAGSYAELGIQSFSMNFDSLIRDKSSNQLDLSNIKSVKLNSIELKLDNPDSTNNLQNFSSASLKIKSNLNSSYETLGSLSSIPDSYTTIITIPVNSVIDLKDLAKNGPLFSYSIQAVLRKATNKTLYCQVRVDYQITAGL